MISIYRQKLDNNVEIKNVLMLNIKGDILKWNTNMETMHGQCLLLDSTTSTS